MTLNEHVGKFIQNHSLLSREFHLLLGVSGGLDSMVLMDLLHVHDVKFAVAHVHYRLREAASEEMHLVKYRCLLKNLTSHTYEVSDEERDEMKAGNLQEKARNIRYNFLRELRSEHEYSHIVTAHHLDDQVEGFILRLLRSSGLEGLTGMSESDEAGLLRPLLDIPKSDLYEYAKEREIPYMDDVSNLSNDYDRNYIRNEVLPIIEHRFPEYRNAIKSSIDHLGESRGLLTHFIEREKKHFTQEYEDGMNVSHIGDINKLPGASTLLWYLIRHYGFNITMAKDMLRSGTGAIFYSETHQALVDRNKIMIRPRKQRTDTLVKISEMGIHAVNENLDLLVKEVDRHEVKDNSNVEFFDLEKIAFPMTIREWQPGDRFRPIGMKGNSKKVKDYLTDEKVPRTEKENALVLTSSDDIIWLMGRRMDDRYKITEHTSRILMMKMLYSE